MMRKNGKPFDLEREFGRFSHLISHLNVKEFVPEAPGVYKGFSETGNDNLSLTYVGRTSCLRRRLHHHDRANCTHFQFMVVRDEQRRKSLEEELIALLQPPRNRDGYEGSGMTEYRWKL